MMTTNVQATKWKLACKKIFGRSKGNRNESQTIGGKKKSHNSQNEQVCVNETDHGSEFTRAAVKLNRMTKLPHKHRANQSGASLDFVTVSMVGAFNDLSITCSR
jgi:hypothetical protein